MTIHVPEALEPARGDYAWLGAESDSVADRMYMLNTEDWREAINSRFVNELLDDTLPEEILKSYLIQDFKFYNPGMMARLIKLVAMVRGQRGHVFPAFPRGLPRQPAGV